MAIVSIIVSLLGLVLSFILGFPVSLVIGPYVGLAIGLIGLVLAIVGHKKKSGASTAALIISIIVIALCVIRALSFASCVGRLAGMVAGIGG